ncbi:MAG: 4-hydroxythreonine-4-phosphate dehydrogenase PdxA [Dehalococcoidia bacterium]
MADTRPVLALTIGDPAGIGPEITAKALVEQDLYSQMKPLVIGDARVMETVIQGCGLDLKLKAVSNASEVSGEAGTLEILDLANLPHHQFGVVDGSHGHAAVEYIEKACELAREGAVQGIVTAPINKEAIKAGGSTFPGHTEMIGSLFGVPDSEVFTLFILDKLRIFFLTRHHSLANAIKKIDQDIVVNALVETHGLSAQLGLTNPRLALAALNPHAGENGILGTEENEILKPALERVREMGIEVAGPIPADAVFYQCRQGRWDAVLSLYHDQGHIAAKTVDFYGTVSCTLGYPVVRTSVDHGTAFDIAGKWIAEARGQVGAMRVAAELAPAVLAARQTVRA